ncbi:hypothetical protein BMAGN_1283 [Bifidobacterium magnum]|uniref:Uncharacterized protein n=1 Tax=Bifidobacterium magnum TaxID=1692 RepID=A0A087BEW6_9BIFI|nr:hypothetical protein BMAGN_1283 [Bifidobacterium magnum]
MCAQCNRVSTRMAGNPEEGTVASRTSVLLMMLAAFITLAICGVCCAWCTPAVAFAKETKTESRSTKHSDTADGSDQDSDQGSVTVTYAYGDDALTGVAVSLYKVATVHNEHLTATAQFKKYAIDWNHDEGASTVNWTDSWSKKLARILDENALADDLHPDAIDHIDADGTVTFDHLGSGLYLLGLDSYTNATTRCSQSAQLVWVGAGQGSRNVSVTPDATCQTDATTSKANTTVGQNTEGTAAPTNLVPHAFTTRNVFAFAAVGVAIALGVLVTLAVCDARRRRKSSKR